MQTQSSQDPRARKEKQNLSIKSRELDLSCILEYVDRIIKSTKHIFREGGIRYLSDGEPNE